MQNTAPAPRFSFKFRHDQQRQQIAADKASAAQYGKLLGKRKRLLKQYLLAGGDLLALLPR